MAFAKAQMAAGATLPTRGTVFISVNDNDKRGVLRVAKELERLGFRILATEGTALALRAVGVIAEHVFKVKEGRPHVVDRIKNGEVDLVINTPLGKESFFDEYSIRREAISHSVPLITTLAGAHAAVSGVAALAGEGLSVRSLQEYHAEGELARERPESAGATPP
jgi:carbamoyl-phosphate synthase large subunit